MALVTDLSTARRIVAPTLPHDPPHALRYYFALEHDPRRTRLFVHLDARGQPAAFVAVCQTGLDLFRPLVVLHGDARGLDDALAAALLPGRPYLVSAQLEHHDWLRARAHSAELERCRVLFLTRERFQPVVNILVQISQTPDGLPRATIHSRDGETVAEAGVSWMSSRYAEVFVQVAEAARGRGLGKSVVSAVSARVLEMGRTPLYVSPEQNAASLALAQRLGYVDSGARELNGSLVAR